MKSAKYLLPSFILAMSVLGMVGCHHDHHNDRDRRDYDHRVDRDLHYDHHDDEHHD